MYCQYIAVVSPAWVNSCSCSFQSRILSLVLAPLSPGPGVGWEWGCYIANPPIAQLWVPTPV